MKPIERNAIYIPAWDAVLGTGWDEAEIARLQAHCGVEWDPGCRRSGVP